MKPSAPKVGIFWLIPTNQNRQMLVYFAQDLNKANFVDMYYDSTFEHIKCWQKVLRKYPELKTAPYEKYPRGRITFISKDFPSSRSITGISSGFLLIHVSSNF